MFPGSLRKKDLHIISEKTFVSPITQKSRSRQKIRSKSKGITQSSNGQLYQTNKKNQSLKAYHFSNSIYQGEVKAFQRVGKGMIIHDNGLTGLIRSGTNRLKDQNVFFGHNIIISAIYKERQLDFVYKNGNRFLVLNMQKNGQQIGLNSIGYLIELDYQRVSRLKFKNGSIIEKIVLTRQEINQIINQEKFEKIMRQQHIEALKFNLFDPSFTNIQIIPKNNNQIHIGYIEARATHYSTTYQLSYQDKDYRNRNLEGLGMILQKNSHDSNKQFRYETRILQRGFYSNGRLEYFGEIFYVGGNHYFGGIKNQEMHGNGILVYENQNRFVFGKFNQGKPIYLDQNASYRLNTQQGVNLYTALRRKLHSEDPEVWIDGEVLDLPDLQYFKYQLDECSQFNYIDKEVQNYLKQQEDLKLSRKVQDFQKEGRNSRTVSQRKSNPVNFDQKEDTQKSSPSKLPNLIQSKNIAAQINYQVQEQNMRRAIANQFANNQSSPLFSFGPNNGANPVIETPIRRINTGNLEPSQGGIDNPQINRSIVQGFNLNDIHSSQNNKNSRTSSHSKQKGLLSQEQKQKALALTSNNSLNEPTRYKVSVRGPIQGSRASERLIPRSASRSASRSLSRGSSKSIGNKQNLFQESEELVKTFQRSPKPSQKRSILDRLYGSANGREQILQRQYAMLQKNDKLKNSINRNYSPGKMANRLSQSPGKAYNYSAYTDGPTQMDIKMLAASSEALKLAHSNRVKEEKIQQYEHIYTHKKRFDYTSQSYDERGGRPYGNVGVLSKQTHFQRTPDKKSRYEKYDSNSGNRNSNKEVIDGLVNRLYPKHLTQDYPKRPQHIYDSRYEQEQPLNRYGLVRGEQRITRQLQQDEIPNKFTYGKDFKTSVLKNNAVRS